MVCGPQRAAHHRPAQGALATAGIGTALAPVYLAHRARRAISVFANETRPLLQGSLLTAWELAHAGIPVTVLTDGMAASFMRAGEIDVVLVGADRVAANGDTANKIGTDEVRFALGAAISPAAATVRNPAFDITPAEQISAVITDKGVYREPYVFTYQSSHA